MSQFPATDLGIPATKDFVRAEIAELRTELRVHVGELRAELHRHTAWTIATLSGVVIAVGAIAELLG